MRWHPLLASTTLTCMTLAMPNAFAQGAITIYRCTDAAGTVTVQNDAPCPAGSTQTKRVLEGVPSASSPTAPVNRVAPVVPATPPPATGTSAPMRTDGLTTPGVIPATERPPPPPLFECRATNGGMRLADNADPVERCASQLTMGGSTACDVDTSTPCVSVPSTALCERWEQRLRDARLGAGLDAGMFARAEIARAEAVLASTTCTATE